MAGAVDFDDESALQADEVDRKGSDLLLATEDAARAAVGAELAPEVAFCFR
jgi:hypothetical protein